MPCLCLSLPKRHGRASGEWAVPDTAAAAAADADAVVVGKLYPAQTSRVGGWFSAFGHYSPFVVEPASSWRVDVVVAAGARQTFAPVSRW